MSATVSIYGLIDPRTNECRYVGKAKSLTRRLREHLSPASLTPRTHKTRWLRSLLMENLRPDVLIFEEAEETDWEEAEHFWIAYLKMLGAKLTNGSLGGEGGDIGPEGRKKQADALRGQKRQISPQHRANIAKFNRERAKDPVWLERIRASARRRYLRDPNHVRNASLAAIGAPRTARYQFDCIQCGAPFETTTRKSRYCTHKCALRAWKQGKRVEYK